MFTYDQIKYFLLLLFISHIGLFVLCFVILEQLLYNCGLIYYLQTVVNFIVWRLSVLITLLKRIIIDFLVIAFYKSST